LVKKVLVGLWEQDEVEATAAQSSCDRSTKQSQVLACVAQLPPIQVRQRPGVAVAQSVMVVA